MVNADVRVPPEFPAQHPARGREARDPSEVGRRIGDRYQIEAVLAEGAGTITIAARHLTLEERVLVQILSPEQRFDGKLSAEYLRAGRALARIKTEHVARVLDVGVALYLGPFLVLEELTGNTLAQVLKAEGPLPMARAVEYVLQACKGLAVAHAAGIVHGQLQPSRLLLARQGEFETLKVVDFPLLGELCAEREAVYLAPELAGARRGADRRADVWSLGAVLYELVTGRAALAPALAGPTASTGEALNEAGLNEAGLNEAGLNEAGPGDVALSPALRKIIARCLQPDPQQRFADVEELAAELLPLTTMNEVFRGSLTGSFSRQMLVAAAAQARAVATAQSRTAQSRPASSSGAPTERFGLRFARPSALFQRWSARWRELARRWGELQPSGAPPLQHALLGAAAALLALIAALSSELTLRPPPRQQGQTPALALAAPSPAAPSPVPATEAAAESVAEPGAAQPSAPDAPEPAVTATQAQAGASSAGVPVPAAAAAGGRPAAVREPSAPTRRANKAAAEKKRSTRERSARARGSAARGRERAPR